MSKYDCRIQLNIDETIKLEADSKEQAEELARQHVLNYLLKKAEIKVNAISTVEQEALLYAAKLVFGECMREAWEEGMVTIK